MAGAPPSSGRRNSSDTAGPVSGGFVMCDNKCPSQRVKLSNTICQVTSESRSPTLSLAPFHLAGETPKRYKITIEESLDTSSGTMLRSEKYT
jgi:hypothetical protein